MVAIAKREAKSWVKIINKSYCYFQEELKALLFLFCIFKLMGNIMEIPIHLERR